MKKTLLIFTVLMVSILFNSCKKDDVDPDCTETTCDQVTVSNFAATIDENPTQGQVLGTIVASGCSTLSYEIVTLSRMGKTVSANIEVNSSTGELTVGNISAFNYENSTTVSTTIKVSDGTYDATLSVTITLNDVVEPSEEVER